jgi:hypothetical protein
MSEGTEYMPTAPPTAPQPTQISEPDWRSEPRKSPTDLCSRNVFVRMTQGDRDSLKRLAGLRGESEAEFIRQLIRREACFVLQDQADAKLSPTPEQREQSEGALAFLKLLGKACRRHLRETWK